MKELQLVRQMVLRKLAFTVLVAIDLGLLVDLVSGNRLSTLPEWLLLHLVCSVLCALVFTSLLEDSADNNPRALGIFVAMAVWFLPGAGALGIASSVMFIHRQARKRKHDASVLQVTKLHRLPFTTPRNREITTPDSRGFTEHIIYSSDDQDIYRKVLAAANIRVSLAVDALRQAMRHDDERIRLTAYNALDSKVTNLNRTIQELEASLQFKDADQRSDTWLRIASNYWELLTLSGSEPVARAQLLSKAAAAATCAVKSMPRSRNAQFVLGRISLARGNTRIAKVSLERSRELGMPADKVIPYLAECAFVEKDVKRVERLLSQLSPAAVVYPPLSAVANFWR
ncbi:MAG: hypothetical protein AB8B63_07340 [Granulosicoccus sp.]